MAQRVGQPWTNRAAVCVWVIHTLSLTRVGLRLRAIAYEHGEGVVRDQVLAASLYCHSARLGDVVAQYNLGWMSFFFQAAADQGLEVAGNMLRVVGGPTSEVSNACARRPRGRAPIRAATK